MEVVKDESFSGHFGIELFDGTLTTESGSLKIEVAWTTGDYFTVFVAGEKYRISGVSFLEDVVQEIARQKEEEEQVDG